jgi:hypothetical protein
MPVGPVRDGAGPSRRCSPCAAAARRSRAAPGPQDQLTVEHAVDLNWAATAAWTSGNFAVKSSPLRDHNRTSSPRQPAPTRKPSHFNSSRDRPACRAARAAVRLLRRARAGAAPLGRATSCPWPQCHPRPVLRKSGGAQQVRRSSFVTPYLHRRSQQKRHEQWHDHRTGNDPEPQSTEHSSHDRSSGHRHNEGPCCSARSGNVRPGNTGRSRSASWAATPPATGSRPA